MEQIKSMAAAIGTAAPAPTTQAPAVTTQNAAIAIPITAAIVSPGLLAMAVATPDKS